MVRFSQCLDCQNFIGKNSEGKFICPAFPDGIPDEVFVSKIDHTEHIEGDNGIKYQEVEGFGKKE